MAHLPHLQQAVLELGTTFAQRAERLGVSEKTVRRWIGGDFPEAMQKIAALPVLVEAFNRDALDVQQQPTDPTT